jgi:hypothetical protein
MKTLIFAAALAFAPLAAAAESYDCTTTNFGQGGWVPDRIILGLDRKANAGSAFDGLIKHVHKTPIPVKLKQWSETRFQFNWTLDDVDISNESSGSISYKVTLHPQKGKFTLSAILKGYDNQISGSGTCKLIS